MASNLSAMASNLLLGMACNRKSDGLQPDSNGLPPNRDGLQPSDGLQPTSDGLQPTTAMVSILIAVACLLLVPSGQSLHSRALVTENEQFGLVRSPPAIVRGVVEACHPAQAPPDIH